MFRRHHSGLLPDYDDGYADFVQLGLPAPRSRDVAIHVARRSHAFYRKTQDVHVRHATEHQ